MFDSKEVIDETGEPIDHPLGQAGRDLRQQLDGLGGVRDRECYRPPSALLDEVLFDQVVEVPLERAPGDVERVGHLTRLRRAVLQ